MKIEMDSTEIIDTNVIGIEVQPSIEVTPSEAVALDITFDNNEYSIVGDDMVIVTKYDDAPQWLKDTIDNIVNIKTAIAVGDLEQVKESLDVMLDELDVAKNTYQLSIISSDDIDSRINTAITTLNSSLQEADATILHIAQTATTPEEASAIAINTLSASLSSNGAIGSALYELQTAMATLDRTTAESLSYLNSVMEGEINGNAEAMQVLRTYVGVSEDGGATGTGLLADVQILQKQNDGVIETVTGTYPVMVNPENPELAELILTAEPYASWKAADVTGIDTRLAHIGDVYIKYRITDNGAREYIASFKFIRTVVDASDAYKSTDADGFTWAMIVDQVAQDAYNQALSAYDLADGKRRVFVGLGATTTPKIPYEQGDLWLIDTARTVNGYSAKVGDILRCIESKVAEGATYEQNDWVLASSYANAVQAEADALENWKSTTYANTITNIQTQVDKKAETFYQNSVPTGRTTVTNVVVDAELDKYVGDLWKNTYVGTISGYLGNNTEYIYSKIANGSKWDYKWVRMEVPDIVFDTIDTKKSIYSGNSVPVIVAPDELQVNDMWITGDNPVTPYTAKSVYVWNGTAWAPPLRYTDDTAVTALQTGLANGTTTIKLTNAYVGTVPLTTYLSSEIDNKVGVYSGTTAPVSGQPSGVAVNDIYLWFTTQVASGKTYDITRTYKYSGSAWNEITTNDDITNLADLADGKRTIFGGNVVPTGAVERDLWIPSANVSSYVKGEIYQYISGVWSPTTRYTADIQALTSNVQAQIDSKVDTYYQDTIPFANATNVARKTQAGDYWYCTLTAGSYVKGKMYKYAETANGSNWNYTWTETADVTKYAFDVADGKASIFTTSAQPSSYKINDMLIVTTASFSNGTTTFSNGVVLTSNATRTSGFVAADWVKKINDTEDLEAFVSGIYEPKVASLQSQVDGKIESWYTVSTSDPKIAWTTAEVRLQHNGDMWYQTDTKKSYWYSNVTHSWNLIEDQTALTALANAAAAQASADGVVVSFYAIKQDTAPATTSMWLNKTGTKVLKEYKTSWVNVAVQTGDTLMAYDPVTKDMSTYVYNGSGWITNTENGMVAESKSVTDLTASLSTTNGVVSGHTTQLSTVDTRIANGVASVETKWAYDSNVTLNGVSYQSGFGLATSLTSGSGLPTGASEFWIKADKFKLMSADGSKKSAYSPFSVDTTTGAIMFNGKVTFSNVIGATVGGANLLYNSAPTVGMETKGWQVDYNTTGIPSSGLLATGDTYRPIGGAAFHQYIPGTPAVGTVFDIRAVNAIPVIGGQYYEGSAYLNSHRCDSRVYVGWRDSSGSTISWSLGDIVAQTNTGNVLSTWGRSKFIVQAPANAASCYFYVRGTSTGEANPYVFASMCYFGVASEGQTVYSNWSDGISASTSSDEVVGAINAGSTTTINGGMITTGSITTGQIQAYSVSADRLSSTNSSSTVWTGGGLVSANFNGNVNGSIGTPTQGFRLSSNAAGTTSDPNIYGAYIKGSTIEGSTVNVTDLKVQSELYPGKFGPIYMSRYNIPVLGPNYSSGYDSRRVCSVSKSTIKIEGWFRARGNYVSCVLEYQLNGSGTWNYIADRSAQMYGYLDFMYLTFAEYLPVSNIGASDVVLFRIRPTSGNDYSTSPLLITISNG